MLIKVEPYWNVNLVNESYLKLIKNIKVEPYWNVNECENMELTAIVQLK